MQISEILPLYAQHPQVAGLARLLAEGQPALIHLQGLQASAAPMVFASLTARQQVVCRPFLIVLDDEEEAGYFYHDLTQMLGEEQVFFYPSAYRRAVKYAQRDAANEILRTDVLNRLSKQFDASRPLYIVSYPDALSERVAPPDSLKERTLHIEQGGSYDLSDLTHRLLELGFVRKDYV